MQWHEAYDAAEQHNRAIVGGLSSGGSIGAAGGWLSGGGHSLISPNYGLGTPSPSNMVHSYSHDGFAGVDNVLEITIVTADGNHVIANEYRNNDLFWALRGGGGGTWGVVTSATYKTHPSTPFSGAYLLANTTNADSTQNFITEIIRLTPLLVEQGYGGYGTKTADLFQLFLMSPNVTAEETQATFLPLFEFAASQPDLLLDNSTLLYQDFGEFYQIFDDSNGTMVGIPEEVASWLLPKDVVQTDKPEELAAELLKTSGFLYW